MIKFVTTFTPPQPKNELKFELVYHDSEIELRATNREGVSAAVLGIRRDGTLVRYVGSQAVLQALGFQTEVDKDRAASVIKSRN